MKKLVISAGIIALSLSATAFAGDPAAGEAKSAICKTCHGQDMKTPIMGQYPKLAGQNEQYLVSSMMAYKSGQRQGGMSAVMKGQMAALTQTDMENLAAYIASLP